MWQVAHPIWEKRSRPCRPSLPCFNGVGGARKRTKSLVKSSASCVISGSGAGSTPAGSGLPPTASSVGRAGFVGSEEHTSELQSRLHIACRPLLVKTKRLEQRHITA